MSATINRRAVRLIAGVVLVFLAGGCAGHKAAPTPASARSTAASTPAPTATPLTATELAWITAVTNLHHKADKPFHASSMTMTRAKMTELGNALRACHRGLRRMGAPGTRLQPVYVMVNKAFRTLDRGAGASPKPPASVTPPARPSRAPWRHASRIGHSRAVLRLRATAATSSARLRQKRQRSRPNSRDGRAQSAASADFLFSG
jgi:hypothetical protein